MSHEIRTPMNAVMGFLAIALDRTDLAKDLRSHLDTAHNSAKGLLTIINDILDVSKLEAGKFELEKVVINVPKTVKDALRMLQHKAETKRLTLEFKYDSNLSHCFEGDAVRLRQIITNLVSNAIKFTDKGSIVICVNKAKEEGKLLFAISDTGIGMSPEQAESVLQPFAQADESISRRFGGTGLGTTISKDIVDLMNGHIWVESEVSKGSTFYFTAEMPKAECNSGCTEMGITSATPKLFSPHCFNVLIAEDIEANNNEKTLALISPFQKELNRVVTAIEQLKVPEKTDPFEKQVFDPVEVGRSTHCI